MGPFFGTTKKIQEEVQELLRTNSKQLCARCIKQVQSVYKDNKNKPQQMDKKIQFLFKQQNSVPCYHCRIKIKSFYERVNKIGMQQSNKQIGKKQQGFSNNSQTQAQKIIVISQFLDCLSRGDFTQVSRTMKKIHQKDILLFKMAAGYELIKRTLQGNQQQSRFTIDMMPPQGLEILKKVELSYKNLIESNQILSNQEKYRTQSQIFTQKTTKSAQGQCQGQVKRQLQIKNQQLLKSITSLKKQIKQFELKQNKQAIQINQLNFSLLAKNTQISKIKSQNQKITSIIQGKITEIKEITQNYHKQCEKKDQISKLLQKLETKNNDLNNQLKAYQKETKILNENLTQRSNQLRQLSIKHKRQNEQFNKLFYQSEKLKEQNKKLLQQIQKSKTGSLLQTSQLKGLTQQLKATFSQIISSRFKKRIRNTHILYRFDPMNPVNFHKYIDGHENILLIYKTKGDKNIFAGSFSLGKLRPNQNLRQDSILFSLTQNKFFNPKKNIQNYVSICYEQNLFIIGNSELRIKHRESSVFSNFGIMMGCYDAEGRNYEVFVGESEQKKCDLEGYEIYSIQFE